MDLTESIAPKSDQLNADDLISGPITVTIRDVAKGNPEQPVDVHLVEYPGRAYRPSKSMRRVMVSAWGPEASTYAGHQLTLYRNPEITFGRDKVGGIEISHLSHIDKALTIALTATRGKRKNFTVQPIAVTSAPATPAVDESTIDEWVQAFNTATTVAQLQAAWEGAGSDGVTRNPRVIAAKDAKKAELAEGQS